jgi:hypothetical protein
MIRTRLSTAIAAALGLAACTTGTLQPVTTTATSGKPVVSAAMVGSDTLNLAGVVNLASAVYATTPSPNQTVLTNLTTAKNALTAAGNDLKNSGATSGDLKANINLAYTGIQAAEAAAAATGPSGATAAAKLNSYINVFLASAELYNTDAAQLGLPTVPLPTATASSEIIYGSARLAGWMTGNPETPRLLLRRMATNISL